MGVHFFKTRQDTHTMKRYFFTKEPKTVDFMIVGIQKGGTSWLSTTLDYLPQLKKSYPKETKFFNAAWKSKYGNMSDNRVRLKYMKKYWPDAKEEKLFEASPGYFASPNAAERISKYFPESKFVVLLRDPVSRAFSQYSMWVRNKGIKQSFFETYHPVMKAIEEKSHISDELEFYTSIHCSTQQSIITQGLYYYHFLAWYEKFSKDQFFIMTTKQLNSPEIYGELLDFIGLDKEALKHIPFNLEPKDRNVTMEIDNENKSALKDFYDPYNQKLFNLLNISSLDW